MCKINYSYGKVSHTLKLNDQNIFRKIIVCYFSIPQDMNTSQGLTPSHVDPDICTHIIVGFARVVNCSLNLGEYSWVYRQISDLKNHEPNLKVMVSAGGINELNSGFPEMTKTHANRNMYLFFY